MPWLVRNEGPENPDLLFVHVPRCGGTSLTKLFNVPDKSRKGQNLYHKIGLTYFFYRYKLLETRNFPVASIENVIVALQVALGVLLWWFGVAGSIDPNCDAAEGAMCFPGAPSLVMWTTATLTFICSTFLFTAPISGRMDAMRRAYAVFVGRILFNFTAAYPMLTGVGHLGYIVHWTAEKMVRYGFVDRTDFAKLDNFTIVRNPYTRMVSIFGYNRFGPLESFDHFVEDWYAKWKRYREHETTDENMVYCHVLPQFEYTHMGGEQLVKCVIKQEALKQIVLGERNECFTNSEKAVIPPRILQALKDMPHSNRRQRDKPWQDYYSKRSMSLVLEMYAKDFALFDYETEIPGRPDLDEVALRFAESGGMPFPDEAFRDESSSESGSSDAGDSVATPRTSEDPIAEMLTLV